MTYTLSPVEGARYLAHAGLPLVAQELVRSADAAADAAAELGLPVALKLVAAGRSHKSDGGGVRLRVGSLDQVRSVAAELLAMGLGEGESDVAVLVQPMATGVVEIIVGIARDPTFGPVIAVGFGGTLTELIDDVALGIAPLSRQHAIDMLAGLRGSALLDGYRGAPAVDRVSVVDLLMKVSRLALDADLLELDLNPVLIGPKGQGCVAVDNRVVLQVRPSRFGDEPAMEDQ